MIEKGIPGKVKAEMIVERAWAALGQALQAAT